MKTINVYEVGVDPLPLVGMEICYWENHVSFGTFSNYEMKNGSVGLCVPDGEEYDENKIFIGEEEIEDNGDSSCFDEWGLPTKQMLYIDDPDIILTRGMRWMYEYEYLNALGADDIFPFQEADAFNAAVKHGFIDVIDTKVTMTKKDSIGKNRPDCDLYFVHKIVKYNDKLFELSYASTVGDLIQNHPFEIKGLDYV